MDVQLSPDFALSEFRGASHRALTSAEEGRAEWWANQVLQPARDVVGPIRISSYVRTRKPGTLQAETGAHKDGEGIDVVPIQVSNRALADLLSATALEAGLVAQVITYEGGSHVHIARSLVPGATAGYLAFDGRRYNPTAPEPLAISTADYRVILAAAAAAFLLVMVVGS